MSKRIFVTPDFYSDFKCKAGECRRSCCRGWHITVTMEEYYRLIGLDCPDGLRRRLDGAVFPLDSPSSERFAEFAKDWAGDCRLHGEDGLCMLQCACGESALPSVCRYYPRSPRTRHAAECSLSVSCEGVCELLMKKKEPIKLVGNELDFEYNLPEMSGGFVTDCYRGVREMFFTILQNRSLPFSARMRQTVEAAWRLNPFYLSRSLDEMESVERECVLFGDNAACMTTIEAFDRAVLLLRRLSEKFPLEDYSRKCDGVNFGEYLGRRERFYEKFPDSDTIFEQITVNHVFYDGFPFSEAREDIYEAAAVLCVLYAVWKLCLVLCAEDEDGFADLTSDIFRMAENSNFNLCAAVLLGECGFFDPDKLSKLCDI